MVKFAMTLDGQRILRGHSGFLMILTPCLTIGSYLGLFTGRGPYRGLAQNPMAFAGLMQAYPLMGLVGVAMWMGASGPTPHRFSWLVIAAHCVPLSTLVLRWEPVMASFIVPAISLSFLIHGGGIAAEFVSLRVGYGRNFSEAAG